MSSDKLIYLISTVASERDSLARYFRKHQFQIEVFDTVEAGQGAVAAKSPVLIVLACSKIPSPDICKFGAFVEQHSTAPIIALLTPLQMSIVTEMAESENLWTAEYPISLREIRASIVEALEELQQA